MDAREAIARWLCKNASYNPDADWVGGGPLWRWQLDNADRLLADIAANQLAVVGREGDEHDRLKAQKDDMVRRSPEGKVIAAAKILSICWTTPGQPVDGEQTCAAIEDLHRAVCALYGVDPAVGFKMLSPSPLSTGDRR